MNERVLKQLAERAGYHPDIFEMCKPGMTKFAQLIVEECIDLVDGYTKPRTFETHYDAVEQIKHHFGVEE